MMPEGWFICGACGCIVSPYDPMCPQCEWTMLGARPRHQKNARW